MRNPMLQQRLDSGWPSGQPAPACGFAIGLWNCFDEIPDGIASSKQRRSPVPGYRALAMQTGITGQRAGRQPEQKRDPV